MQGQAQPPSFSYIPRFSWRAGTSPVCELGLGNGKLANEASWFWVKRYRGRDVLWRRTLIVLSFSLLLFPFESLAQTVNICSRTDEIQAAILSELPSGTNCDSVTSAQLAGITSLVAGHNNISMLRVGDFSGLTGLENLDLFNIQLTTLPEKLFDGLTSLENLWLYRSSLTSLPEKLFDGLTSLENLRLNHNSLNNLPEGLFDGLTSLEDLVLHTNALTSLPGDLFDGLTSLEDLALNFNPLTSLPEDLFDGLTSLKDLNLDTCPLLKSLPEDLFAGLTRLENLKLSGLTLTSLPDDLFDGLTSLEDLDLSFNLLTSLPGDLFDEPTSLEHLWLNNNSLTSLPENLFAGLTSLEDLALSANSLTSLPENLFNGLTSLEDLALSRNSLTSLPENLFNGLTSLEHVGLYYNSLTSLPEGLFVGLTSLEDLRLFNNSLTSLPEDLFDGLSSLEYLYLSSNSLTSLEEDLFDGLTSLARLRLNNNSLTSLPANLFDHVESPQALSVRLGGNSIACLPAAIVNNSAVTITPEFNVCGIVTATLLLSPASISENGGSTTVTATLDHVSSAATTVTISATPQSPATGSDYKLSTNTTLTIAAGETESTGTVTITAVDNDRDEPDKIIVASGSATNTQGIINPSDVMLTITDDDRVSITAATSVVVPDGGSTDLPVALSAEPTANVTLTITGHAGTDLTPNPRILTFTPANWGTPQPVTLTAAEDEDVMDDQVALTLTASGGGYTGVTHSVAVTITDNDVAAITAPASVVVPEGGSGNLQVSLSSQPTGAVTVMVTGHAGTDLTPNLPELTFSDTNWNTSQSVTLTAAEDGDITNDQVTLALTASGGGYAGVTHSVAVTITDNDVAAITAPASVVVPEGGSGNLQVSLSSQPTGAVTVMVTGHAGTDLTPNPPELIFSDTNWNTPQSVTLTAAEDGDITNDQVTLALTASGGGYAGVTHSVAVAITDNDVAAITAPASVVVPEGGSGNLQVSLSAQPATDVTVEITGHAGTDLIPNPPELIFSDTNWNTPQSVTLTAAEDGDITNDQVTLALTASGGGYTGVTHSVAVTITDNDVASIAAATSAVVPEGSSTDLPVALSAEPTANVTLTITGQEGTDLTPNPRILTFTPANWGTPQPVTLTAAEDEDVTDDQVALTLTASGGGYAGVTHSVAVTITDNDVASIAAATSAVVPEGSSTDLPVCAFGAAERQM